MCTMSELMYKVPKIIHKEKAENFKTGQTIALGLISCFIL